MRAPNPKGQGDGGDGQAVEDGRGAVQWERFLAARSPCQLILQIPEVAQAVDRTLRSVRSSELENIPTSFKTSLHTQKQRSPHGWTQHRVKMTEASAKRLRATCIAIADQEAFQTGQLRLLYLNDQRNIVREVRLDHKSAGLTGLISHGYSMLGTSKTNLVEKIQA
ncbi:unnamed protein product [Penicillium camemberti]|uniref:Str. FM013 n=1 Tax=Penicillium camemberti (strain FM 013) TaxID=1429867 RepID=A0A0G4PLS9_PENC3|nr:unnamed protein product [Penicillium camemberti]